MSASAAGTPPAPKQAVILAGGRGTRLRPLTDEMPKPMVAFHGKPFLEYLVDMLREQGFERVTMLLGFKAEVIQDHFGDGSAFGVSIDYSVTGADDQTASRVRVAEPLLDPHFLLLYCDNYWPLQLERMWTRFLELATPAMVTVYENMDGYSRDGVAVGEDGMVAVFDRTRKTPGLRGVEISYAVLDRDAVLEVLPDAKQLAARDLPFEEAVYPPLVERRALAAYETGHRYYSVGSLERLPLTEEFLAREPAIILDRDGVLNRRPPRAEYVRSPEELEWLPASLEALALLAERGYRTIVVTNQAGIARGAMSASDLERVHERLRADAAAAGGRIDAIYHCPHGWDEGCECRKPRPGMLFQAQREFALDLTRTLFVGDDERDREAADAAGCRSVLVDDAVSLLDVVSAEVARPFGTLEKVS